MIDEELLTNKIINVVAQHLPIVVINVIEYKNADEYDHLCGFIDGGTPVC